MTGFFRVKLLNMLSPIPTEPPLEVTIPVSFVGPWAASVNTTIGVLKSGGVVTVAIPNFGANSVNATVIVSNTFALPDTTWQPGKISYHNANSITQSISITDNNTNATGSVQWISPRNDPVNTSINIGTLAKGSPYTFSNTNTAGVGGTSGAGVTFYYLAY